MLPDRKPQVTFSCDASDATCNFQFWVGKVESFYCGLQNCTARSISTQDHNSTQYTCDTVQCSCIPDRMLCGEKGSVGASRERTQESHAEERSADRVARVPCPDITDFLVEEIKGPGKFTCRTDGKGCKFEEVSTAASSLSAAR